MSLALPIGRSDFRELVDSKFDFVDKSLFIKDILSDRAAKVQLITRPRRFGKTLNISMLRYFLAAEVNGKATKGLFDQLKIAQAGAEFMAQQGQYPVIFLTLKDVKDGSAENAFAQLRFLLSNLYVEHQLALQSDKLNAQDKNFCALMISGNPTKAELSIALKNLTRYLTVSHGIEPWVLIDEYDTPIYASFTAQYHHEMLDFFRFFLGSALKDNSYLNRAVLTGILRIGKESLFSGLNNLEVHSLLHQPYSQYFGFTETEVADLLQRAQLSQHTAQIKAWYNGYQVGDTVVYNPWSIVNCIKQQGAFNLYWVNTSDNQLIRHLLNQSNDMFKTDFEGLLRTNSTQQLIDDNLVLADLATDAGSIWSLLYAAGYLKVINQNRTLDGLECELTIPNEEVRQLYYQIIKKWLSYSQGISWYNHFLARLLNGDINAFEADLTYLMASTLSHHDMGNQPEAFYHGFMLGVTASLCHDKQYILQSNRESGYGRYDYMILAQDKTKPTLILEFKQIKQEHNTVQLEETLLQTAEAALAQIANQQYLATAKQQGCSYIIKMGLAFCGKQFKLCSEVIKE